MKKFSALLAGLFFIFIAIASWAEESEEDYIVGPRDILYISVWGEGDMQEKVEVPADGEVPFFFIGKVRVAGLTVSQVRDKLTTQLADGYIRNPLVIVKVEEYHSKEVQIQGAVAKPGTYILTTNTTTLLKLISMAGGTTPERGNRAIITRGEAWREAEIARLLANRETDAVAGDTSSPPAPPFGWMADSAPGSSVDASSAPPAPPAPKPKTKLPEVPANVQVTVDLRDLLDRGDYVHDLTIHPGDFVMIGSSKVDTITENYVFVEGAVRTPQQIEFAQGLTALQAVIQAGGFSDVASPNRSTLTRVAPDGTISSTRIKLRDIQRGKLPDVPLKPGDRINVPESIF